MGTWGTAVDADDTFQDVIAVFDHHLKREQSIDAATQAVLTAYSEELEDFDDGPSVLFALTDRQWTYGKVDPELLERIQADGFGLANWQDAPESDQKKRKSEIGKFITRVSTGNEKPKKLPKIVRRKPKFSPGDCLSFQFDDGRFTGGYVLATNESDPEHGRDLIVMLDYLDADPPSLQPFEQRQWLRLHHGSWGGELDCAWYGPRQFRSVSKLISVVGKVPVQDDDPQDVNGHKDWEGFGHQILYIERLQHGGT